MGLPRHLQGRLHGIIFRRIIQQTARLAQVKGLRKTQHRQTIDGQYRLRPPRKTTTNPLCQRRQGPQRAIGQIDKPDALAQRLGQAADQIAHANRLTAGDINHLAR